MSDKPQTEQTFAALVPEDKRKAVFEHYQACSECRNTHDLCPEGQKLLQK